MELEVRLLEELNRQLFLRVKAKYTENTGTNYATSGGSLLCGTTAKLDT